MEWSATILLAFGVGLAIGVVSAGYLQRRSGHEARERAEQLAGELDETREELEAQRAEVAKHFEETSDLFRDLTEHYTRLYAHLSEGAREFCTTDVPALARGLEGPLLEASRDSHSGDSRQVGDGSEAGGDSEPAEPPAAHEAPRPQAEASGPHAVA